MASQLDRSHISSFESLLLSNLALYSTNLVASLVTKFQGIVARCLSKHFQSFLSFLGVYPVFYTCFTTLHKDKGLLRISMCDFVRNYEEMAAYTCVAKTCLNARVHAIMNFTSNLAVIFCHVTIAALKENSKIQD